MRFLSLFCIILYTVNSFASFDKFNVYQYQKSKSFERPWFEWWYYKVVLPEENESFYFVYGVVNPWDSMKKNSASRAYVKMGDFSAKTQIEKVNSPVSFFASYDQTLVQIENNQATENNFFGSIVDENGKTYSWDIDIKKDWSYNAAGWATGKNVTDIEWYPAQAGAHCSGKIVSGKKELVFKDAPCYQDRNWGSLFPKWWTWIVSNQFENHPESVLAVGGGWPSFNGKYTPVKGVSIGLFHKGKEYHFRPNHLNLVKTKVVMGKWWVSGENPLYKVEVEATAPMEKFMDLEFLTPQGVLFHDYETLEGRVRVKIFKKDKLKWKLVDEIFSNYAGIEYGAP